MAEFVLMLQSFNILMLYEINMKDSLEVEIKAPVAKLSDIEKILVSIHAQFKEETIEEDHYYQHPCKDYQQTDEALRIRISETRGFLTYKGPKLDKDTKSRTELEIAIDDPESYKRLLEHLGFKEAGQVLKTRKTYIFQNCSIMLDSVKALGTFIEIECFGDFEVCKKSIFEVAKILKLENFERRSYFELIKDKK